MNEPISMWSGAIVCVQPRRLPTPWTVITFEPMPSICGAHRDEHPRQVLDVRLGGGVADHGRPARQRGGHQRVLGGHHRRLVHQEVARPQAERGLEPDVAAVVLDRGAERAERVEVRVEPPAADHVAAGRRHVRAAEAGQQRAGEQERGADPLGQLAVDLAAVDARGVDRDLAAPSHCDPGAELLEQQGHRLHVPDPRDVAQDHLVVGEQARGQDRQRAVLVAGGNDRARQGLPPSITNFSMGPSTFSRPDQLGCLGRTRRRLCASRGPTGR